MSWGDNSLKLAMKSLPKLFSILHVPTSTKSIGSREKPEWHRWHVNRFGYDLYLRIIDTVGGLSTGSVTRITDRNWDSLIVLDACRHDALVHVYGQDVPLVTSPGSDTHQWTVANYVENTDTRDLCNVVLVTANTIPSEEYFRMNGWEFPMAECVSVYKDAWDYNLNTVHPAEVVKKCCEALQGGRKRLIAHFLQPHAPFIGKTRIGDAPLETLSLRRVKKAYEANLRLGLRWAMKLVNVLEGKVVITSDHGNLFGEYGLYHHPPIRVPELLEVPWLELSAGGENPSELLREIDSRDGSGG
ncbi:MAG: hypothetical protein GTO63_29340 [Anaerolineae bacterium]|nr:hypothetical protein [Anaerolineae bacterium]